MFCLYGAILPCTIACAIQYHKLKKTIMSKEQIMEVVTGVATIAVGYVLANMIYAKFLSGSATASTGMTSSGTTTATK